MLCYICMNYFIVNTRQNVLFCLPSLQNQREDEYSLRFILYVLFPLFLHVVSLVVDFVLTFRKCFLVSIGTCINLNINSTHAQKVFQFPSHSKRSVVKLAI